MSKKKRKLLIAVGGTGGHLFPAQALAQDLMREMPEIELLFAGAGLSSNHYFHREKFSYQDVSSATPFRGNLFKAGGQIFSGVRKGVGLVQEYKPDLVIGFGSFHSFPLLVAALYKKVPFLLFEPNAIPGKVNRLLSRWAETTAVQFPHAKTLLKGKTLEVAMPLARSPIDRKLAHAYFGLNPDLPTILVFGGSQGAASINRTFCEASAFLKRAFQVIHITGRKGDMQEVKRSYESLDLRASVKEFEERMDYAFSAADLAICRAGAVTLAELIAYEVPAILIPFPLAADDHQRRNAEVMEKEICGARMLLESELNPQRLAGVVQTLLAEEKEEMKKSLRRFKEKAEKGALSELVRKTLL